MLLIDVLVGLVNILFIGLGVVFLRKTNKTKVSRTLGILYLGMGIFGSFTVINLMFF